MEELRDLKEQLNDALIQSGKVAREDFLFNPSFAYLGGQKYVFTLRRVCGVSLIRTQIIFEVEINEDHGLESIGNFQELSEIHGNIIRDLKFGIAGNQTFATWNTGHPTNPRLSNQVFVSPYPNLPDISIAGWSRRSRIEKNWGFFQHDQNFFCIYSLSPLVLLSSTDKIGDARLIFDVFSSSRRMRIFGRALSIGSQPIREGENLILTAHLKPRFFKFRLYFPLLVTLNLINLRYTIEFLWFPRKGLSFRRSRLNPFAFAVNYASGFAPCRKGYLMGMGVADEDYKLFLLAKA